MACDKDELKHVPLFALLDDEETAVLAGQVELKKFAPRQRIYKISEPGGKRTSWCPAAVRITTVDEDHQEVVVDQPAPASFSASPACWTGRHIRPTPSLLKKRSAWRWNPMTSPSYCSASQWRAWTCSPCWAGSSTPRSNWCGLGHAQPERSDWSGRDARFGEHIADAVARFGGS